MLGRLSTLCPARGSWAIPRRGVHIEKRLQELGITLPPVNPPVANYKLANIVGNTLFTGTAARRPCPSPAGLALLAREAVKGLRAVASPHSPPFSGPGRVGCIDSFAPSLPARRPRPWFESSLHCVMIPYCCLRRARACACLCPWTLIPMVCDDPVPRPRVPPCCCVASGPFAEACGWPHVGG